MSVARLTMPMREALRVLLLISLSLGGFIGSIAVTHEFFSGYEWWGLVPACLWFAVVVKIEWRRQRIETERKRAPVIDTLYGTGVMDRKENDYRDRLLREIRANLMTHTVKPQAQLHTGTLVDGRFEHAGDEWYVTIKREVDNQERLRLQGEVEDIILDIESRKGGDVWIMIVAGLFTDAGTNSTAHIDALRNYAASRQVIHNFHRGRERHIAIEVVAVEMAA